MSVIWQGTSGPLGKPPGSVELPEGHTMASVGPCWRAVTCGASSSSFEEAGIIGIGE